MSRNCESMTQGMPDRRGTTLGKPLHAIQREDGPSLLVDTAMSASERVLGDVKVSTIIVNGEKRRC